MALCRWLLCHVFVSRDISLGEPDSGDVSAILLQDRKHLSKSESITHSSEPGMSP